VFFFLHLGKEAKPKWESVTLYSTVATLLIIVIGTLWIMYDLNNRVMPGM
jgi:cytochrome o ubiquinol oxidase operon protein cyoD